MYETSHAKPRMLQKELQELQMNILLHLRFIFSCVCVLQGAACVAECWLQCVEVCRGVLQRALRCVDVCCSVRICIYPTLEV